MKILVTGSAGFIGSQLVLALLQRGHEVVGIDNVNDYYDPRLKYARLREAGILAAIDDGDAMPWHKEIYSSQHQSYKFIKVGVEEKERILEIFEREHFDAVSHMAAQAGVRYSLTNPDAYIVSNMVGFANILEACRTCHVQNLSYASSSSVYGLNQEMPFSEQHHVDHPASLYAATKKSNELMAHTYAHLYGMRTTGLRFFTVYGPWGRPDMAPYLFVKAALEGRPIDVYNYGDMLRDFTYIDDIVEGVCRVVENPAEAGERWAGDPASSSAAYKIYNIGCNKPVKLMDFISAIEKKLGVELEKNFLPMQPGDVQATYADVSALVADHQYKPQVTVNEGVSRFVDWFRLQYA